MNTSKGSSTGANRGNGGRKENLCSLCFLLFKSGPGRVVEPDFDQSVSEGVTIHSKRGDEPDFTFLARDTASPYIDNRPFLVATKLREDKCVHGLNDEEIGLVNDGLVVNCAPYASRCQLNLYAPNGPGRSGSHSLNCFRISSLNSGNLLQRCSRSSVGLQSQFMKVA